MTCLEECQVGDHVLEGVAAGQHDQRTHREVDLACPPGDTFDQVPASQQCLVVHEGELLRRPRVQKFISECRGGEREHRRDVRGT